MHNIIKRSYCFSDCKLKHDDLNINLDILTPKHWDEPLCKNVHLQLLDSCSTEKDRSHLLAVSEESGHWLKAELLRTVKRFERLKTDLISTIRSKEWRLDSESKLFVRVNDQRTYLQNELMICQNNIMRLQRNGSYWQNGLRKNDQRIMDSNRGPIKKIFGNDRLPPIATK